MLERLTLGGLLVLALRWVLVPEQEPLELILAQQVPKRLVLVPQPVLVRRLGRGRGRVPLQVWLLVLETQLILEQLKLVLPPSVKPLVVLRVVLRVGPLVRLLAILLALLIQVEHPHFLIRLTVRDLSLYRIHLIVNGALVIIWPVLAPQYQYYLMNLSLDHNQKVLNHYSLPVQA